MYRNGKGVPQDFVWAHMWLNLAAAQGTDLAKEGRDEVAKGCRSLGGGTVVRFPRFWMLSGECRLIRFQEEVFRWTGRKFNQVYGVLPVVQLY